MQIKQTRHEHLNKMPKSFDGAFIFKISIYNYTFMIKKEDMNTLPAGATRLT